MWDGTMGSLKTDSADLNSLKMLSKLIEKSKPMLSDLTDSPKIDYDTKDKSLAIVNSGYTILPSLYQQVFLDPLKNLITNEDYPTILRALNHSGPWNDWMASINQRVSGYQKNATHAFEESIADLYDGFLSMEERRGVKTPDHETVSPLVKWGNPNDGPYTWPADTGSRIGLKMAVVNMPPAYSKNVALWAALGHETGGHDILHADDGLLGELAKTVETKILEKSSPSLKKQKVIFNGRKIPLVKFVADYWKNRIDETASDVCGILNLGPAAAVGLAVLLIPLRGNKLISYGYTDDVHPIDALRIYLAMDVISKIPDLDATIAKSWVDSLQSVTDKYISDKTKFTLYTITNGSEHLDATIPFQGMRELITVVADTIAFSPLNSLENHSLSEINTWSNSDESIMLQIANDFLNNKELSITEDNQTVYAAHIISAATIALANSADITNMTNLAINALNKLYDNNPVWRGFPVRFRSDTYIDHMVSHYKDVHKLQK